MNNRWWALMASSSKMVPKSEETGPAQRWASSATTRSNLGTRPNVNSFAISGDDWYVAKTTRRSTATEERGDLLPVGGYRKAQITGGRHCGIGFGNGLVRAHGEELEIDPAVGRPLPHRLRQQR